jgi:hypothetical protein
MVAANVCHSCSLVHKTMLECASSLLPLCCSKCTVCRILVDGLEIRELCCSWQGVLQVWVDRIFCASKPRDSYPKGVTHADGQDSDDQADTLTSAEVVTLRCKS